MLKETKSKDDWYRGWLLIRKASDFTMKARKRELVPYQISPQQFHIMDILCNLARKATLVELGKYSDKGVSTISHQLSTMEKDGLAKKIRENPKSVLKKFELTEKGIKIYQETSRRKSIKKIMSILSEEELHQLILILQKIIKESEKS